MVSSVRIGRWVERQFRQEVRGGRSIAQAAEPYAFGPGLEFCRWRGGLLRGRDDALTEPIGPVAPGRRRTSDVNSRDDGRAHGA
jgi:hypothetical protein